MQREFFCVTLKKSSQFIVVFSLQSAFDNYVLLEDLQKFTFQGRYLCGREKGLDESKVSVGELSIVPYLLGDKQRTQEDRSPIGGLYVARSVGYHAVGLDETYDATLDGELGAVEERFDEVEDVVFGWFGAQDGQSFFAEFFRFFFDVFLFAEGP